MRSAPCTCTAAGTPSSVDSWAPTVCHMPMQALVVRIIKLLHAQQQALGIALAGSAKDSIDLQPMSSQELGRVCSLAVAAALRQRGWTPLGEAHLLGGSLLALADGMTHAVDSVQLRAEAAPGSKSSAITLLLQAGAASGAGCCCRREHFAANGQVHCCGSCL